MLGLPVSATLLTVVLIVFAAVGIAGGRPDRSAALDDYVVARRSQGPGSLALSFLASGLGAWILFAPAEVGAILGLDAVVGYALAAAGPFVVFAVVGPRLRRTLPSGRGLSEFLRLRFGRSAGTVVALLSLLYMGVFVAAELVAVAGLAEILGGIPRAATVLGVVAATLAYTAYGGLRASLRTDRWQAWLVVVLLAGAAAAALSTTAQPVRRLADAGLLRADRPGVESALTLVIAVTAANLFHQGYWQRVWAAEDDRALRRGALLGAAITVPVVFVAGAFGMVAAATGAADVPALSLFALVAELPTAVVAAVLVLGIALVASSVDTLENGLVALVVAERPRMRLRHARLATVLLMVPAAVVGLIAGSVLQLFLIADLLCAALLVPALSGLSPRATTSGVVAGTLGGLGGAYAAGWLATGTAGGALAAVTFPDAVPTLAPFVGALAGGAVGTVLGALVGRGVADAGAVERVVRERLAAERSAAS